MKKLILFLSILVVVAACGGGGGGDATTSAITYDGRTDPASLTSSNASEISSENEKAGQIAYNIDDSLRDSLSERGLLKIAYDIAKENLGEIAQSDNISGRSSGSVSNILYGSCGGYVTYTGTGDSVTGALNVYMDYRNYCINGNTMDGSVNFNGYYNYYSNYFISGTLAFSNVTYSNAYYSESLNGSITFDSTSLTINCDYTDGLGTKYRAENYTISISGGLYSFSGRLYYEDYGYVDVLTTTPFAIDSSGNIVSGEMVLVGLTSSVKVTYISGVETISVDADGDGIYETTL